ncbi:MAG: hypothetical protein JWN86_1112 [Planctomycetota bacterium]|nr:hypothetical protein [Planctomycetota bacterium]
MSDPRAPGQLKLPESLQTQLHEFRRRVWSIKMAEAVFASAFGIIAAFLLLFALDRVGDTPGWLRAVLFVAACVGCAAIPSAAYRWIWRNRHLEQLARLLTRKHPHVGDQLLGIIELVHSDSEQARSRRLCEAAIEQVAQDARKRDFRDAVPSPKHRLFGWLLAVPAVVAIGLSLAVPAAASNAWARFLAPWKDTPRYTFAALEPLPKTMVVAHGEPFTFAVRLTDRTAWKPEKGLVQLGTRAPVASRLKDGRYEFALPPQIEVGWLIVRIGDAQHRVRIEPMLRPELTSVAAEVALPDYLGRPGLIHKDVRAGAVALVKGSRASFSVTASRALSSARLDGRDAAVSGSTVTAPTVLVEAPLAMEFRWKDTFGLAGKEPFTLAITSRDDEAPSLSCEDLPRQKVVLDSELLSFKVRAQDDFGVRRVGIEWQGIDSPIVKSQTRGERILGAGGNDKEVLELGGTFSAKALGIEPQPIVLRIFAEDYFPGRERVYSSPYTFYVLNAEQHAIWLTEQLSKWHRQSLEVRDREKQLHETNKQLRELTSEELDRPDTRRRIETQATAERANGRRLSGLVTSGEDLVRQAMRNPEFGVGHLEKWGEMLQILKDISANRMPSVADLLKQASQAPVMAMAAPKGPSPTAGQVRATSAGSPSTPKPGEKPKPGVPGIVDRESQHSSPEKNAAPPDPSPSKSKSPSLRLPVTTLAGKASKAKQPDAPADETVDEAVKQQQDLLAEFEKISEELNKVLANLEGSTLVKRLKAASRTQYKIAGRISDVVSDTFGSPTAAASGTPSKVLTEMSDQEGKGSQDVSLIMDDMQSYFERRQYVQFKTVLDDMKKLDVIGGLRQLGDDIRKEHGVSIAQCEFWSDNLDRWAEDLVDPTASGKCPGSRSRGSLPPSIVLEVLQILEAEVNLREETRVAQQAKAALAVEEYTKGARKLSNTQDGLKDRVVKVNYRIRELPDAENEFAKEMQLLDKVADVMGDASLLLAKPETGSPAIAAETEAIELLLASKRINPKGGGGGGSSPGGGGGGTTNDSALALIGNGQNQKEVREDHGVSQATGDSGPSLPEEFRSGLDEYFNRLERRPGTR